MGNRDKWLGGSNLDWIFFILIKNRININKSNYFCTNKLICWNISFNFIPTICPRKFWTDCGNFMLAALKLSCICFLMLNSYDSCSYTIYISKWTFKPNKRYFHNCRNLQLLICGNFKRSRNVPADGFELFS